MTKAAAKAEMVRAWVDPELKRQAEAALTAIGLTPSTAVTLLYKYIAADGDLPLDLHIPNEETLQAMEDARNGIGLTRYKSVEDLKAEFR